MFCAWTYKTSTRKALTATISIGTLDHDFIRDWGLANCTSFSCGDCSSLSLSIVPRNKHCFIAHFITVLKYKKKVARKWHAIELCSKIWAISFIGMPLLNSCRCQKQDKINMNVRQSNMHSKNAWQLTPSFQWFVSILFGVIIKTVGVNSMQ